MLRIIGAWLAVALLLLAWPGRGAGHADGDGAAFAAIDTLADEVSRYPEPEPEPQPCDGGEAGQDADAASPAGPWHWMQAATGLSITAANAPPCRRCAAYRSQAPPRA